MPTLEDFKKFMQYAEEKLNDIANNGSKRFEKCNGKSLEDEVVKVLQDICNEDNIAFNSAHIKLVSGQKFPDIIVAGKYGIEVKSTKEDKWTSTGSSIVESTRVANVEHIYLLFGKLGGKVKFKCRPYQEVMYDVAVTHSPRYLINMELGIGETIFEEMTKFASKFSPKPQTPITYDELRNSPEAIRYVRQYYIQKAEDEKKTSMPWWLESENTKMSIQLWSSLSKKEKKNFQSKMCILFSDDILSDKTEKYAKASLWLCAKYSILVYNARDCFSAGGQCSQINGKNLGYSVPRVVARYLQCANEIKELFNPRSEIKEEIKEEILEFNKDIWDEVNDKPNYEKWLTHTSKLVGKFAKKNNIPFKKWFENEDVLS